MSRTKRIIEAEEELIATFDEEQQELYDYLKELQEE
tara:strand:- start:1137 stop:1244 length:108 start_codon:yes stop_codon:yes gene_type:complete